MFYKGINETRFTAPLCIIDAGICGGALVNKLSEACKESILIEARKFFGNSDNVNYYRVGRDLSYMNFDRVQRNCINLLSTEYDENHSSPHYFGADKRSQMPKVYRIQESPDFAHKELSDVGIELLSGAEGGNLLNIPRVSYSEYFS